MRRTWTKYLIIAAAVMLIAWDIYVGIYGIPSDTISQVLYRSARKWPVVPFSLGVIMGHLFWPQRLS